MKIAIIGTGISGMVAAYLLGQEHEITVFEANDYIGGHTHTVVAEQEGRTYAVDTGFIVFNHRTYPNFVRLLQRLGVAWQPSNMSFSVTCERTGLEYNGTSLNTLFAQRRNLFRPSFYRMLRDILRFHAAAPALLRHDAATDTLGDYLTNARYSREFIDHYIVPMGAAIWSADPQRMLHFPARYFVQFFHNHGMLQVYKRPQWYVIRGGAVRYVEALTRPYRERIRLRCPVRSVARFPQEVVVTLCSGERQRFEHVVIATHSDQALTLLADPTDAEREILGAFAYQANETILHTDARLLPRRRRAWASWNYYIPREAHGRVTITYNLNILQSLPAPQPFCVTLNRSEAIDPTRILQRMTYHHPVHSARAVAAQARHQELNSLHRRTSFCGAYWGYGFHEDGVNSALTVCHLFGKKLS